MPPHGPPFFFGGFQNSAPRPSARTTHSVPPQPRPCPGRTGRWCRPIPVISRCLDNGRGGGGGSRVASTVLWLVVFASRHFCHPLNLHPRIEPTGPQRPAWKAAADWRSGVKRHLGPMKLPKGQPPPPPPPESANLAASESAARFTRLEGSPENGAGPPLSCPRSETKAQRSKPRGPRGPWGPMPPPPPGPLARRLCLLQGFGAGACPQISVGVLRQPARHRCAHGGGAACAHVLPQVSCPRMCQVLRVEGLQVLKGGVRGGGGRMRTKMAQSDFPFCKFRFLPRSSLWSGGRSPCQK